MVEWAPPGAMPAGVNDAGDDGHRMGEAWRGQVLGLLPWPWAARHEASVGRGDDGMALQAIIASGVFLQLIFEGVAGYFPLERVAPYANRREGKDLSHKRLLLLAINAFITILFRKHRPLTGSKKP